MTTSDDAKLSRRSLLKKSVVAGGVVWVAPTVLAAPAFAVGACPGCATNALFGLKRNNNQSGGGTSSCENPGTNQQGAGQCIANDTDVTTFRPGCCLETAGLVSFDIGTNNSTHIWTIQPGVRFCRGYAKCGSDCRTGAPFVTSAAGPNGTTIVTITCEDLSHSEILVCVDGTAIPAGCA